MLMRVWFLRHLMLVVLHAASILLLLASFVIIIFFQGKFSPPLILHFNPLNGADVFGERFDVFAMWSLGLVFVLLNVLLGRTFFYRERILSYIFAGMNVLLSFLLLIAIAVIVSVNG